MTTANNERQILQNKLFNS